MTKWNVRTIRERAHGEPLVLDADISGEEIGALIDQVFRCDQMAEGRPDREKLLFDFTASRGPLTLSMAGLYWPPEVIRAYEDAERNARERTDWAEAREGSL